MGLNGVVRAVDPRPQPHGRRRAAGAQARARSRRPRPLPGLPSGESLRSGRAHFRRQGPFQETSVGALSSHHFLSLGKSGDTSSHAGTHSPFSSVYFTAACVSMVIPEHRAARPPARTRAPLRDSSSLSLRGGAGNPLMRLFQQQPLKPISA